MKSRSRVLYDAYKLLDHAIAHCRFGSDIGCERTPEPFDKDAADLMIPMRDSLREEYLDEIKKHG